VSALDANGKPVFEKGKTLFFADKTVADALTTRMRELEPNVVWEAQTYKLKNKTGWKVIEAPKKTIANSELVEEVTQANLDELNDLRNQAEGERTPTESAVV
jgi:hypothetical protein